MRSLDSDEDTVNKLKAMTDITSYQLDNILQEKLENAIHKQTSKVCLHDLVKIAHEHTPIDLAYAASHLPSNARAVLYDNLPNREAKIYFILNTDNFTRICVFRDVSEKELKSLFEKMPPDEAVWVMEDMSERKFRKVISLIDVKKAARIKELKKHDRNSAGRLMTSDFFAFNMDITIREAAEYIRDNPSIDISKGIFILNEAKELQGYVPHRNMIINTHDLPLRSVMRPILHKVLPESTREEVIDLVERYKISCLPVTDMDNYLVGVIAYEDIVEAMEDLTDETLAKMGGTSEKMTVQDSILKRFITRFPWLLVTLLAGLINVWVMSSFEKYEKGILTFVLFFVPLITGMSGNIGIQCSTVLIRSMAIGHFVIGDRKGVILKEFFSGLFIGINFGVITGLLTYFLSLFGVGIGASPVAVSVIIGSGLIGACSVGSFLGVFSPLFFARIGVDPAISAGPIVTALNDFLSMSFYFLIALSISRLFF